MRVVVVTLLAANVVIATLGWAGILGGAPPEPRFDPEVPGFRGRLLELLDRVAPAELAADISGSGRCFVTERARDPESAGRLLARWDARGINAIAVHDRGDGAVLGYWVLTGPVETRDQLLEMQRTIENQGFPALLQQGGENSQRISVGFFRDQSAAERHRDRLRQAGVDVSLAPRRLAGGGVLLGGSSAAAPDAELLAQSNAAIRPLECSELRAMVPVEGL